MGALWHCSGWTELVVVMMADSSIKKSTLNGEAISFMGTYGDGRCSWEKFRASWEIMGEIEI